MARDLPPLNGLDLNMLVTLRAIVREASVSRAAEMLSLSQPTVSRTLSVLRNAFDDPLLVRSGRGMALTPLATTLKVPLDRSLAALDRLRALGSFDSSADERVFRVIIPDILGVSAVPILVQKLEEAPGIGLQILGSERLALTSLLNDTVDLVVGAPNFDHPELYSRRIASDPLNMKVVYGPRHPNWAIGMCAKDWLKSQHIQLTPSENPSEPSKFERELAHRGLHRHIRVHLAYVGALGPLLERTPMVVSLADKVAKEVIAGHQLRVEPHPYADLMDDFDIRMTWHAIHHDDAGHVWFRDTMASAIRAAHA